MRIKLIGVLIVLAVVVLIAVGIYAQDRHHEKELREANIALSQHKDELRVSALAVKPLVEEYAILQGVLASSTSTDEEKAPAQARLNDLTSQIADLLPNARTGWNDEGYAILVDVDHMRQLIASKLRYAGTK